MTRIKPNPSKLPGPTPAVRLRRGRAEHADVFLAALAGYCANPSHADESPEQLARRAWRVADAYEALSCSRSERNGPGGTQPPGPEKVHSRAAESLSRAAERFNR